MLNVLHLGVIIAGMINRHNVISMIAAAGIGSRFGGKVPKQYHTILGKPMLYHSVKVLRDHKKIEQVYILLSPKDPFFKSFDWSEFGEKVIPLYVGDATRAETVRNGLLKINGSKEDWVLVHDAARPCLSIEALNNLLQNLDRATSGVVLAKKVTDTIKKVEPRTSEITQTLDRSMLWHALTPQVFRYGLLSDILSKGQISFITDESSAVEKAGLKPLVIECNTANPKVTKTEDLALAEFILRKREDYNENRTRI